MFKRFAATCSAALLLLAFGLPVQASTWTDQADYVPGSTVLISGDSDERSPFWVGEAVLVDVAGPNGYTALCSAEVSSSGEWSCSITLWSTLDAVGDYTYVAIGQQSGVQAIGSFADAPASAGDVYFRTSGITGTHSVTVTGTYYKHGSGLTTLSETFDSPGPSNKVGMVAGSGFTYTYPVVTFGITVCTPASTTSQSGTAPEANAELTVTMEYTCVDPDTTPPVIQLVVTPAAPDGANGWYTSNITIDWTVTDTGSAVVIDSGCVDHSPWSTETSSTTLVCTAHSEGGSNTQSFSFKLDKTGPGTSIWSEGTLGTNGWYVSDVTIKVSGTDAISDSVTCSADQYLTVDTSSASFTGTCTNGAGLSTVTPVAKVVKRDATKPTLSPSVSPSPVVLNGSATALPNAADATSGIASSSCDPVDSTSIGSHTVACTATDNAGNTETATASYTVVYDFQGFFAPIGNTGAWKKAQAGSSIPVKFTIGGYAGLDIFNSGYPKITQRGCPAAKTSIETIVEYATGTANSGLVWDPVAMQYVYVWKTTKDLAGKCFDFDLGLNDGSTHTFKVQFTK